MWGMFSQYISHHHLAVLLFVMPCSLTFLRDERRTPRVLIYGPDPSDLTYAGGRKIGPLILFAMPLDIEANAGWMCGSGCDLLCALYLACSWQILPLSFLSSQPLNGYFSFQAWHHTLSGALRSSEFKVCLLHRIR